MLEEKYVATGLGRLRVETGGEGPALMFWSSLLMDASMWAAQVEHFLPNHRVIVVDPPGHGRSQALSRPFTFDECAEAIVRILDALDVERTHFVGNSWGGMIGGTFAATYPDRVGAAVLMNCTASPAGRKQQIEYGALVTIARVIGGFRGPLLKPAVDAFLGPTTKEHKPDVVSAVKAAIRRLDINSVHWAVTSVVPRRPDQLALIAGITSPVLVVAGVEDATFPVAETRAMADAIPGAEFVVLDGAAHLAALESPAETNALIESFLARHA